MYGADISEVMIKLAESQEVDPANITYLVADCSAPLAIDRQFDVVSSTYLLQNAHSVEMLEKFVKTMYDLVKPGGKLIGLNASMHLKPQELKLHEKYGDFIRTEKGTLEEGDKITLAFKEDPNGPFIDVIIYYHKPETYEAIFAKVGFRDFKWIPFSLADDV